MSDPIDFDPTLPAQDSPVVSLELRNQFNALKGLVDNAQATADSAPSSVNAVAPLAIAISNPPTQAQVQSIVNKVDEMLAALYRW